MIRRAKPLVTLRKMLIPRTAGEDTQGILLSQEREVNVSEAGCRLEQGHLVLGRSGGRERVLCCY